MIAFEEGRKTCIGLATEAYEFVRIGTINKKVSTPRR